MNSTVAHTVRPGDNLYRLAQTYQTTVESIMARNQNLDPHNLTIGNTIYIHAGDNAEKSHPMPDRPEIIECVLQRDMREMWSQHVFWTRLLLISIAARLKDEAATTKRLLRNPGDIAAIFARYFDKADVDAVQKLLTEHLEIGAKLITALRDRQSRQAEQLNKQWYENAEQLAEALYMMNPNYDVDMLKAMMRTHLDLTTKEVVARLAGKYEDDIAAMDDVEREALAMADYLARGILQ